MSRNMSMMLVSDILRKATNSLDMGGIGTADGWWRILANKVSHAHFDNIVESIQNDGFTMPIVLVERDADEYTIGNGHHRLCAAILLGINAIPVVITEGDYWAFEDSHDEEWNPGERSFDTWGLLQMNMPSGHYGDCHNEVHRGQFANRDDATCDVCGYSDCECCGECESYPCQCATPCYHCDNEVSGDYEADHKIGCPEREYELLYCHECGYSHYRHNACDDMVREWHAEAIAEHEARGFTFCAWPAGAWHPIGVLVVAYGDHADWLRDEPVRQARADWEESVQHMRNAVIAGCSDTLVNIIAGKIRTKWDAWQSL